MDIEDLSIVCSFGMEKIDDDGNRIGYDKHDYCLDNLKGLLRFLRRDDPQERQVFKQICKWKIVSKDLIPIIENYQDDRNLVLNAVKVMVFLTMPIEPSSIDIPQQIEYLWDLKAALTCSNIIPVIVSLLEGPLENLESDALTEDDWKLVQLVLTLFRNILAIHDISSVQKAGGSANYFLSLRDKFLELLFNENVMELIIVIAQSIGGSCRFLRQDNVLLLEICHYILLGQDPESVAKAHLEVSKVGGANKASVDSLKSIMEKEAVNKKLARNRNMSRHSLFSGTFTRLSVDGSTAVLKGDPSNLKSAIVKHKTRGAADKIAWEHGPLPLVTGNILRLLQDFVNQFLSGGFNVLMQSIRKDIEKEHHAIQDGEIVVFFQVAQFITSVHYYKTLISKSTVGVESTEASEDEHDHTTFCKGDICGPIAASMDESMFSLVISRWRYAFEGLKETKNYKFLSAAGSLMKTMICMLELVLKLLPEDSRGARTTRILLYKLFYDQTDQGMTQFVLNLIKTFDIHKQPKSDLADLVEIVHMVVGLMENLQANGTLRVSKKSRKRRKNKAPKATKDGDELSGNPLATSNETEISTKEAAESATSVEKEGIGGPMLTSEPGMSETEIGDTGDKTPPSDNTQPLQKGDDVSSADDSSGDDQPTATAEVDFEVSTFVSTFANYSIIQNLCWLLKFYKSNSTRTNHHIVCMLRKITDDLELSPMLYQLSTVMIFYEILDEQKSCPGKDYENIVHFLTSLVRGLLKKMKTQPLLFVEILFWKTRKECHYINAEYMLHELGNVRKDLRNQDDTVDGETEPSRAKEWNRRSLADALGDDEADVVITHQPVYENERGSMELESQSVPQKKKRLVLDDDMEIKIRDLYEKFKDSTNYSRIIAESLDPDGRISAAQVANKLKQLGLVTTRKRLRRGSFSADSSQHAEGQTMDSENTPRDPDETGAASLREPLNTRKRVAAFSKDQEALIKDFFEQFKEQRRCCYLIANALGSESENKFTAAQVSRKLKQLGLRVVRPKTTVGKHLRDDELNNGSADSAQDSDNEPLSAMMNRSKRKDGFKQVDEELGEQNMEPKVLDYSDDETLGAILKKTRKLPLEAKIEKLTTTPTNEGDNVNYRDSDSEADLERDLSKTRVIGLEQDFDTETKMDVDGEDLADVNGMDDDDDNELADANGMDDDEDDDNELADSEDELADSGDDLAPVASIDSALLRRKLRMVEDDDD